MATAVFGRKKHMTQAFQDDGTLVGVTVIEVEPNLITASRTSGEDGYDAVQVGFGSVKSNRVKKAHAGTFAKLDAPPRRHLREGRGFQGTVKRHGFGRGPVTHGSHNVRQPGSVGASADPARIFKGQKMPGQMGNKAVTVRNLEVVAVDAENNELWVRGGVPGGKGAVDKIRK